ncbi:hypothetical protein ABEP17_03565 [Priestia flexa]|uniref:hypothetical protein n=1 Tax=Priestia flexa TaxID=86664 RepID=UPI0020424D6F|nr:hypothetical protein [Priestia flexa]MCM3066669.1 hypothetical protein [Priestia flexa]
MKRFIGWLSVLLIGYVVYQIRYRLVNVFFRNSFLRSLAVRSFFNIPYVRERLMNQVFR